ncbi:MAG: PQQ-binding-like beta-propeller repeat protein, partial [Solirubrobacterales bacterium]
MGVKRCDVLVFSFAFVLIAASSLFAHQDVAGEPKWASLGGDYRRSGLSGDAGPLTCEIRWKFETDGAVVGSTTVGAEGQIYVACEDGKLYALSSEGTALWTLDVNTPLVSAPSIGSDGSLYVGGKTGRVYAVTSDGQLRWTHATGGAVYSSPAVDANGIVYVGSVDGTLSALSAADGTLLWMCMLRGYQAASRSAIFASPSIGLDGTVYIGDLYEPALYALPPAGAGIKWLCRFPADMNDPNTHAWPFASPVVADDGTIYQTLLYDRSLHAIEPATGRIRWSVRFSDPAIPVGEYDVIPANGDGWSEPVLGPDGTIYVCFDDPYIHAVDSSGTVKWAKPFGQVGGFTMTVDKTGTLYAACDDGCLYMITSDGTELGRCQTGGWPAFPVIAADGLLIVADSRDYSFLAEPKKN